MSLCSWRRSFEYCHLRQVRCNELVSGLPFVAAGWGNASDFRKIALFGSKPLRSHLSD